MKSTVKLFSLDYNEIQTYLTALMFVAGNVVLPQLFHLFPAGGTTWLPIYFFTLIGAYKYGWKAGLLTAIASPLVNSWLFGMPAPILMKSVLLAAGAGYIAHRSKQVSVLLLLLVVAFYQVTGTLGEWLLSGSLHTALQDFRIGLPGMALQVFGGYLFIKYLIYK